MNRHRWRVNNYDGEPDTSAYSEGYHNGPECEECGYYFCHHCNPEGWDTECGAVNAEPGSDSNLDAAMVAFDSATRARIGLPPV